MDQESIEITKLLKAWTSGDADALQALTPKVYVELQRAAARPYAQREDGAHPASHGVGA